MTISMCFKARANRTKALQKQVVRQLLRERGAATAAETRAPSPPPAPAKPN